MPEPPQIVQGPPLSENASLLRLIERIQGFKVRAVILHLRAYSPNERNFERLERVAPRAAFPAARLRRSLSAVA